MLTTVYEIRTINTNQFVRVALAGTQEAQVVVGEVGQSYSLDGWDCEILPVNTRRESVREYRQVVRRIDEESVRARLLADADDIEAEMDRVEDRKRQKVKDRRWLEEHHQREKALEHQQVANAIARDHTEAVQSISINYSWR